MRLFALVSLLALASATAFAQPYDHGHTHAPHTRAIEFPDVPGYQTLVVDLHMHTVFSDGNVWPSIRVQEANRDGLDVIATTEHLEYQPHDQDIPHPDRNRSFEIMQQAAASSDLIVIPGAEITRSMPPGHANALFIQDANALLIDDAEAAFREAKRQGAFTFWNHPNWVSHRPNGLAELTDMHRRLIADGLLHGIEVANEHTISEEALAIALEYDLVILGTSDIHGLVDWEFDVPEGGHRPVTLVFATEHTTDAFREGLEAGRTVVFFGHGLVGRAEHMQPLLDASLQVTSTEWTTDDSSVLAVTVENRSEAPLTLQNEGDLTLHSSMDVVTIPAHDRVTIEVKPGSRVAGVEVPFRVLNATTAPGEHPVWTLRAEAPTATE